MKIKFDSCIYKIQLIDHDIIKDRLLKLINETPFQETTKDNRDPSTKWGSHITRCDWCYNDKKDRDWYGIFPLKGKLLNTLDASQTKINNNAEITNIKKILGLETKQKYKTKEDLLKQLSEKTISCRDVTFRIFGLSLTSINIVISLLFIITLLKIFNEYEKNQ